MEERTIFIKPCPCCGSVADITHGGTFNRIYTSVAVRCLNRECGLMMDKTGVNMLEAREMAVNAWNKRAEA